MGRTLFVGLGALAAACGGSGGGDGGVLPGAGSAPLRPLAAETLGGPIPGLTPPQLEAFRRGKEIFVKRFRPSEGLGPLYNATACASCHSTPEVGGSGRLYRNFYLAMIGTPPFQVPLPGLPSAVVPAYGGSNLGGTFSLENGRFVIPDKVDIFDVTLAQRNAIPVFGTGLFEFVGDATILANADPDDLDGDGISGRVNIDHGDIGRFGVKAQSNNVERFTRPPLFNQMGVTSDPFDGSAGTVSLSSAAVQATVDPDLPLIDFDGVPDPEMSRDDLGDLIAFSRFLAPPDRLPFGPLEEAGEAQFLSIGCAACHVPSLESSLGPVEAYSDLLLHDMGAGLADGLHFGAIGPGGIDSRSEFRTQPLWGVRLHGPFLHDGRAETLEEAVLFHGGEAQASRDDFAALSAHDRRAVLSFLEHL